jgi:hypothetical protein
MIYFVYFHAVMDYGIFWGDSVESKRIFQKQTRIIRIMTGSTSRISCKTLFKKLEVWCLDLPIHSFLDEVSHIKLGNLHI